MTNQDVGLGAALIKTIQPEVPIDLEKLYNSIERKKAMTAMQTKAWYRLLKVLFIGTVGFSAISMLVALVDDPEMTAWGLILGEAVIFAIAWGFKKLFFYIVLGA